MKGSSGIAVAQKLMKKVLTFSAIGVSFISEG